MPDEKIMAITARHLAGTPGPYQWRHMGGMWHLLETVTTYRRVVLSTVPAGSFDGPQVLAVRRDGRLIPLTGDHPDAQALAHAWQDIEDLLADRAALIEENARLKQQLHDAYHTVGRN